MPLDPLTHPDWEIALEAESRMKTCYQLGEELGLTMDELLPVGSGRYAQWFGAAV